MSAHRMKQRVFSHDLLRLLHESSRSFETLLRKLPDLLPRTEPSVMSPEVTGGAGCKTAVFLWSQRNSQGLRDAARELLLHVEDVSELSGRSAQAALGAMPQVDRPERDLPSRQRANELSPRDI